MSTTESRAKVRIEACRADCQAARQAIQAAREIMQHQDARWDIQAWQVPADDGSLRLTLAGNIPYGRVPASFRRKWFLALADAALDEVRLINEQERA